MKKSCKSWWPNQPVVFLTMIFTKFILVTLVFLCLDLYNPGYSQGVIPTKGKDFWVGFPKQANFSTASKRCELFITSEYNTSGVIVIPQQGWIMNFTVVANQTTTINIPVAVAEHISSQTIDNKGIQVMSMDTISLFAISFQSYSADATVVYPKQSLGTRYRIASYQGLTNYPSQFLIVATEDGTQVVVTPTNNTTNGSLAGNPFTVNLNAGQSYQVRATNLGDLTGTTIEATDSSGSCRPFAVFSGTECVNIPVGCTWCDVLFDQALPVTSWGKTYYSAPFASTTKYTIRILADQNNTSYSMNGGAPVILNAGQYTTLNNLTTPSCISANKPISVIQYMQGRACAAAGDPAMMYLNAMEQKISQVTFSTVTSNVITQHFVNVIMNTNHINQLKLDGVSVASSAFTSFTGCTNISYAQLTLTQGSHTLEADSGFSAYTYGTGQDESYAYSVGSFSKTQPVHIDSVLCSSDTIHLGGNTTLFGTWWSTIDDPLDTIATGPILTLLPPIMPGIYLMNGNEFISGCEKVFYFAVEIPDPPQIWLTSSVTQACTNNIIQLNAGTTPPMPGYQYAWSPATGLNDPNIPNPVLTATVSGWYHVAVSANNNCSPTVYDSVYIEVLPLPTSVINAGGNQSICLGQQTQLTVNGGVSFLWNPGGYTSNIISVSPVVNTDYIVMVTDSNGCINSDTVTVFVLPLPAVALGNDVTICEGTSTTLIANGGLSYIWNPGGNLTNSITVSPSVNTLYSVSATDNNGCSNSDSVWVLVSPLPPVNAGIDKVICQNDTINLIATGATTYEWMPGNLPGANISVTPLQTSTFIVTGTDANGCSNKDTVIVNVNNLPTVIAGINQQVCIGSSATLTASGASGYTWVPGNLTGPTITVSSLVTTNYVVTGIDSNGCKNYDSLLVTVNPLPIVSAGPDQTACSGDPVTLTATGANSYVWLPGNSTGNSYIFNPVNTITVQVTGTDLNGCVNSDSVQISVNPLPIINVSPNTSICEGYSTTLTASGGTSYLWNPGGATTPNITVSPSSPTLYSVNVWGSNGCMSTGNTFVNIYSTPLVSAGANQAVCIGDSLTLNATGANTYLWIPGNMNIANPVVSPAVTTTYTVMGTDIFGCSSSSIVTIEVNLLPIVTTGINQSICFGSSTTLTASGGISYVWNPGSLTGSTVFISPASNTLYTVEVTDTNGCVNFGSVTITVNPLPLITISPDQYICPGLSANLTASGGSTYIWNPGGYSGNTITVSPNSSQTYIVHVTDNFGCLNSDTTFVGLHPEPISHFYISNPVCELTPFTFTNFSSVSTGTITTYYWDFGDGFSSSDNEPIHQYASVGNFNVNLSIISDEGCIDNYSQSLTVNPVPYADFQTSNQCVGIPVQFNDLSTAITNDISQWYWAFGDGTTQYSVSDPEHVYSQPGWYDVSLTVTTDSGCVSHKTINNALYIYQLPEALFQYSPKDISIMDPVVYFRDHSIGAVSWLWEFGYGQAQSNSQHPTYVYSDTGIFIVSLVVTSSEGCHDTTSTEVRINPYTTLYLPNAFTPNGDGINDNFIPNGISINSFEIFIFDRWGKSIFNSDNINHFWNGNDQNGKQCSQGVYIYKVKVKDFKNRESEHVGQVTLIR